MKVTKLLFGFISLIVLLSCVKDDDATASNNFVRFGLLINTNGQILEFPNAKENIPESSTYTHMSLKTIKIPVVLTSELKNTPTDVFYEVTTEGDFAAFTVSPENKVTIPAGKLVDTLRISFQNSWSTANLNKIKIKITGTSDESISIGWPNSTNKNDLVTIVLGDLEKTRYFFAQNLYNLAGTLNEEILVPINFSQPITNVNVGTFNFITPTFEALSLCDGEGAEFEYSLERLPFVDGASTIYYKFKLLEATPFASLLKFTLATGLPNFEPFGINQTNISKPLNVLRQGDVASHFYNTSDLFYRTYGKAWYIDPVTNLCRWSNFNTFTKPVPVASGSEFDNGLGFHKYRIGFVGNTPPVGTNPFDLRRFYDGANVSSPGYNVLQALDFFPENGTSTTQGIVKVVPQVLSFVKTSNGTTVNVPICGNGTYYFDAANNRWVIYVELHCDETLINGNNDAIKPMYIYSNNSGYVDPPGLSVSCAPRITL